MASAGLDPDSDRKTVKPPPPLRQEGQAVAENSLFEAGFFALFGHVTTLFNGTARPGDLSNDYANERKRAPPSGRGPSNFRHSKRGYQT